MDDRKILCFTYSPSSYDYERNIYNPSEMKWLQTFKDILEAEEKTKIVKKKIQKSINTGKPIKKLTFRYSTFNELEVKNCFYEQIGEIYQIQMPKAKEITLDSEAKLYISFKRDIYKLKLIITEEYQPKIKTLNILDLKDIQNGIIKLDQHLYVPSEIISIPIFDCNKKWKQCHETNYLISKQGEFITSLGEKDVKMRFNKFEKRIYILYENKIFWVDELILNAWNFMKCYDFLIVHIDGDPYNLSLQNLRYLTKEERKAKKKKLKSKIVISYNQNWEREIFLSHNEAAKKLKVPLTTLVRNINVKKVYSKELGEYFRVHDFT